MKSLLDTPRYKKKGQKMNKIWQEHEKVFIKNNANILKDVELADRLSKMTGRKVTLQAVRKQRQKMGINKIPGRGRCRVVGQEENMNIQCSNTCGGCGDKCDGQD